MKNLWIFVLSSLAIACAGRPDDSENELQTRTDCGGATDAHLNLQVESGHGKQPANADLTLRGRATQARGLAIRQVVAQGIPANNDGFNYSVWSVTIPIANLTAQADNGAVTVDISALDACGKKATAAADIELVEVVEPEGG